jgi:hypothetical protein
MFWITLSPAGGLYFSFNEVNRQLRDDMNLKDIPKDVLSKERNAKIVPVVCSVVSIGAFVTVGLMMKDSGKCKFI